MCGRICGPPRLAQYQFGQSFPPKGQHSSFAAGLAAAMARPAVDDSVMMSVA
eukprot:CAMPEP_0175183350 /NCGR_PEP_ID=MMETSP0093-20121207/802_1 /TAXON_ID=311494 /ORGANISM="Alexandrium monilatum, Strain CCMP3105" /LENGTH=51 /DNA_ID=CAMNT_0016475981 /DNA_START=85 /DNA_END=236 /DNA_ORIENTATION=-